MAKVGAVQSPAIPEWYRMRAEEGIAARLYRDDVFAKKREEPDFVAPLRDLSVYAEPVAAYLGSTADAHAPDSPTAVAGRRTGFLPLNIVSEHLAVWRERAEGQAFVISDVKPPPRLKRDGLFVDGKLTDGQRVRFHVTASATDHSPRVTVRLVQRDGAPMDQGGHPFAQVPLAEADLGILVEAVQGLPARHDKRQNLMAILSP